LNLIFEYINLTGTRLKADPINVFKKSCHFHDGIFFYIVEAGKPHPQPLSKGEGSKNNSLAFFLFYREEKKIPLLSFSLSCGEGRGEVSSPFIINLFFACPKKTGIFFIFL
jgi:hypothetical protein